jgi:general secretion pathway protein K
MRPSARRSTHRLRWRQGAALLVAMLIVLFVSVLASSTLWHRHQQIEVETAERARAQASALLVGATDWARLILREDLRSGQTDHLNEPWAIGLEESRLSSFLAADRDNSALLDGSEDVFLSGRIDDQQSMLNLNNLVETGKLVDAQVFALKRLFSALSLPAGQADLLAEQLRYARDPSPNQPGMRLAPLRPTQLSDLLSLGIAPATVEALQGYATLLPSPTPINLNTASMEVIYACLGTISLDQAGQIVRRRDREPLKTTAEVANWVPSAASAINEGRHAVASKYFEVTGQLRIGGFVTYERSLIQRESLSDVRIVWRQRGHTTPGAVSGQRKTQPFDALLQSRP